MSTKPFSRMQSRMWFSLRSVVVWLLILKANYSSFSLYLFAEEYTKFCLKYLGFGFTEVIFIKNPDSTMSLYRLREEQELFQKFLSKSLTDSGFWLKNISKFSRYKS